MIILSRQKYGALIFCRLWNRSEYRFLESLSQLHHVAVWKDVVPSILSTGMTHHFKKHKIINDRIETHGPDVRKWDDMQYLRQANLHPADISNPTWALVVPLEWTHQGDLKREASCPSLYSAIARTLKGRQPIRVCLLWDQPILRSLQLTRQTAR